MMTLDFNAKGLSIGKLGIQRNLYETEDETSGQEESHQEDDLVTVCYIRASESIKIPGNHEVLIKKGTSKD